MKAVLNEYTKTGTKRIEVFLQPEQAKVVEKHGWPDALVLDVGEKEEQRFQLYTLEDWEKTNYGIYSKVNLPLFLCLPTPTSSSLESSSEQS